MLSKRWHDDSNENKGSKRRKASTENIGIQDHRSGAKVATSYAMEEIFKFLPRHKQEHLLYSLIKNNPKFEQMKSKFLDGEYQNALGLLSNIIDYWPTNNGNESQLGWVYNNCDFYDHDFKGSFTKQYRRMFDGEMNSIQAQKIKEANSGDMHRKNEMAIVVIYDALYRRYKNKDNPSEEEVEAMNQLKSNFKNYANEHMKAFIYLPSIYQLEKSDFNKKGVEHDGITWGSDEITLDCDYLVSFEGILELDFHIIGRKKNLKKAKTDVWAYDSFMTELQPIEQRHKKKSKKEISWLRKLILCTNTELTPAAVMLARSKLDCESNNFYRVYDEELNIVVDQFFTENPAKTKYDIAPGLNLTRDFDGYL
ncbi:MAG: hypothetical protein HRT38_18375 [Alteromonadaceae bacterium]|nr:hypothetical protein [Alteromonadaceae bacterium]